MTIFLETERLLLKPTRLADFDDLLALQSDPDVMKYIGGVQTKEDVKVNKFEVMPDVVSDHSPIFIDFVNS